LLSIELLGTWVASLEYRGDNKKDYEDYKLIRKFGRMNISVYTQEGIYIYDIKNRPV
jgi:hypothetical protein